MTLPDPEDLSGEAWAQEWNDFPYKDKVRNQRVFQVGKYHKVPDADVEEVLSHYQLWGNNPT